MTKNVIRGIVAKVVPLAWKNQWKYYSRPDYVDEIDVVDRLFKTFSVKNPTMFDVGAHWGASLIPFASKDWRVFAFEPDEKNRTRLLKNIQGFERVTIEPIAVSENESESMPFFGSDVSSGISTLSAFHDSHKQMGSVPVTTLSKYCSKAKIDQIDFLKIDVEGYDLMVLKGLDWVRMRPRVILTEYDNHKTTKLGYTVRDQIQFLKDLGYEVLISEWFPLVEYGADHRWRGFTWDLTKVDQNNSWGNLIAISKSDASELHKLIEARWLSRIY